MAKLSLISRQVLGHFYLWTEDSEVIKYQNLKAILVLICNLPISFGFFGHILHYLQNNPFSYYPIAEASAGMVANITVFYVILKFYASQDEIRKVLNQLGDFTKFEKPAGIIKKDILLNKIHLYSERLIFILASCVWLYKMMEKCENYKQDECGLIISAYLHFYNIFTPSGRKIYCTFQIVNGITWLFITYTISWIVICCSQYLVEWLRHFKRRLVVLKTIQEKQERWIYLKHWIQYHQHILFMAKKFVGSTELLIIVHISVTPLIISMIIFQIVGVRLEAASIIHLMAWVLGVFAACIMSEMLIYESTSVEYLAYDCIPLDEDIRTTKLLLFIIQRSRKQLAISGVFGICSHEQFMTITKKAYSFLSILFSTMKSGEA